jgi:hypothetical protein
VQVQELDGADGVIVIEPAAADASA